MTTTDDQNSGTRRRIIAPSPPAPVPERRAPVAVAPAEPVEDKSDLRGANVSQGTSDTDVVRATGSMAVATLLSRITGFVRTVLITSTLGGAIASAFQTANQLPNLITEIVLGAVLTSLVVPVLVRAEKEDSDHGEMFVRRLFTLAVTLLGTITLLAVIFAPFLTVMMLDRHGEVNTAQASSFAYLLLPQIFFYGLFALFQAVLNTKGVFAPGAWAPVINNLISIMVLLAYWFVPGRLHPEDASPVTDPHVILLGLGTTAGVVVQCLIMVPYVRRAGINLRPKWGLDARLKQFGGMAVAIIAYVAISQGGYVITSRVASLASKVAPVVYQNAWLLLQVPYGVIGVTLLTAIMPRLSRNAADGDVDGVVRDLTLGTKLTFIALIPIVIFFTGFGVPITRGLFQYGMFDANQAELLGLTLSFSAFTLIPYALVLLHLRVFYAREEAWTPTFIIAGITFTKVVLSLLAPAVANSKEHVVILLGVANGFGFISGAVIGAFLLKRKLGRLGGPEVMRTTYWAVGASLVGLAVIAAINWVLMLAMPPSLPSVFTLVRIVFIGIAFIVITGLVLGRSRLPEVQNLGRALQRIPGMSRFIKVDNSLAIKIEEPEVREITPIFGLDAFNSSPVPPPMSAGIVRGPSLVPGAPVSDGRFRLLRDFGSVPGARFWQAREQATGRIVSLSFVDTTSQAPLAPSTPAAAARRSAQVSRSTRKLGELGLAAVAPNIEVLSYRSGCLVVADWVEGTPLKTVAEADDLDPHAVARALAPLFEDTAAAHEANLLMGLDNRNRLRVSTAGIAVLAFPAVLDSASQAADRKSLGAALSLLVDATSPTPKPLRDITADALLELSDVEERLRDAQEADDAAGGGAVATGSDKPEPMGLAGLARRLRTFAPEGSDDADETLPVIETEAQAAPEPTARPGFGGRGYSGSGLALVAVLATLFVVGMAALTVWIMSLFGGENQPSPVSADSIHSVTTPKNTAPPVFLKPVIAKSVPGANEVGEVVDNNAKTTWSATTADTGLYLSIDSPTFLRHIVVNQTGSQSASGAHFDVYGVDSATFDPGDPDTTSSTKLASGELKGGRNVIDLDDEERPFDAVLLYFTNANSGNKVSISELQLTGVAP